MTITVSCPSCATSFPVDPRKIPEAGVNARCSSCATVFRVERPAPEPPAAVAPPPPPPPEPEPFPEPAFEVPEPSFEEPEPAFEAPEPAATSTGADDWVIEREEEMDRSSLHVEPLDTVERSQEDVPYTAPSEAPDYAATVPEAGAFEPPPPPLAPEPAMAESAPEPEPVAPQGFQFGKRDPTEKARRLARVLVSDMIMYNPERHTRALEAGTIKEDFADEISKSWDEFVDQVGDEMATSNSYFSDALNEILAKGDNIFQGSPPAL